MTGSSDTEPGQLELFASAQVTPRFGVGDDVWCQMLGVRGDVEEFAYRSKPPSGYVYVLTAADGRSYWAAEDKLSVWTPELEEKHLRARLIHDARWAAVTVILAGLGMGVALSIVLLVIVEVLARMNRRPVGPGWIVPLVVASVMVMRGLGQLIHANRIVNTRLLRPGEPRQPMRGWMARVVALDSEAGRDADTFAAGVPVTVLRREDERVLVERDEFYRTLHGWIPASAVVVLEGPGRWATGLRGLPVFFSLALVVTAVAVVLSVTGRL